MNRPHRKTAAGATSRNPAHFFGPGAVGAALALGLLGWLKAAQVDSAENTPAVAGKPVAAADSVGSDKNDGEKKTVEDALEYLNKSRQALAGVMDYTARFTKIEQLDGKKEPLEQVMEMKCRQKPFSIYFLYNSTKEAGREVIFVEGANDGNLLAHEKGLKSLAGTLHLKPDDKQVMDENRYPITEVGIAKIVEKSQKIWEAERGRNAKNMEVKFGSEKVGSVDCDVVEVKRLKPEDGFKFSLTRVFFDKQTKLPIRAIEYGWPAKNGEKAPLLEDYTYSDLKTNVHLTDADFDPKNRNYGF